MAVWIGISIESGYSKVPLAQGISIGLQLAGLHAIKQGFSKPKADGKVAGAQRNRAL